MNMRERVHAVKNFQPVDRLPYTCDAIFACALHRWVEEGLPLNAIPGAAEGNFPGLASLGDYFGCDKSEGPGIPLDFSPIPAFPYEVLEEDEETITSRNGLGIVTKRFRGQEDSMHHFLDHPVKTREDWADMKRRYEPILERRLPEGWSDEMADKINGATHPAGASVHGGIFWTPRDWTGAEGMMYFFYDEPDMMKDMMNTLVDLWIAVLTPVVEKVKLDSVGISEDMSYKNGALISPAQFREFMQPPYRRFVDFLHKNGCENVCIDTDGLVTGLIPLYLECGIREFTPLEVVCGNDVNKLRKEYGRQIILHGNFDKMKMAAGREAIDAEWERLRPAVEAGGFFPQIDHAVPGDVSFANFCYYMEKKRKVLGVE